MLRKTTSLHLKPQRQLDSGKRITKEFFSLINTDKMMIPDDSLSQALVIQYEICCRDVVLPDSDLIQQWKELNKIFKTVSVIYMILFNDPSVQEIANPLEGEDINWKIVKKDYVTGRPRPPKRTTASPLFEKPCKKTCSYNDFRSMILEGGCECSRRPANART